MTITVRVTTYYNWLNDVEYLYFPDDADPDVIDEAASDLARSKFTWDYEIMEEKDHD